MAERARLRFREYDVGAYGRRLVSALRSAANSLVHPPASTLVAGAPGIGLDGQAQPKKGGACPDVKDRLPAPESR
jgi:hypothetical protein